ncbi:MAG TPA: alpha/beta fold hydrolase [Sphingobium sp.]|nr:alpha/beta fold hydrolase [Sphingobium sp.]
MTALMLATPSGCALPRHLLYAPDRPSVALDTTEHPAPEPITVCTADGLALSGYFWPGAAKDRQVILFFHGRNWNPEIAANFAAHLLGAHHGVMVASYRGFGDNPGRPDEAGMLRDAAAFIAEARRRGGPDARIWLVGHSIGAAVALQAAAADTQVSGVIAMSAFARIAQAAPPLARPFIPDRWDNIAALAALHIPVILLEGGQDRFIPGGSGDRLFSASRGPASLLLGETSRHNPDMSLLAPWINQAITAMQTGSLATLPAAPAGWIEKVRRP